MSPDSATGSPDSQDAQSERITAIREELRTLNAHLLMCVCDIEKNRAEPGYITDAIYGLMQQKRSLQSTWVVEEFDALIARMNTRREKCLEEVVQISHIVLQLHKK